jgi:hypothetical protein
LKVSLTITMTWISRGNARQNARTATPHFFKIIYRRMGKMKMSFQVFHDYRRGLFQKDNASQNLSGTHCVLFNQSKVFLNRHCIDLSWSIFYIHIYIVSKLVNKKKHTSILISI